MSTCMLLSVFLLQTNQTIVQFEDGQYLCFQTFTPKLRNHQWHFIHAGSDSRCFWCKVLWLWLGSPGRAPPPQLPPGWAPPWKLQHLGLEGLSGEKRKKSSQEIFICVQDNPVKYMLLQSIIRFCLHVYMGNVSCKDNLISRHVQLRSLCLRRHIKVSSQLVVEDLMK